MNEQQKNVRLRFFNVFFCATERLHPGSRSLSSLHRVEGIATGIYHEKGMMNVMITLNIAFVYEERSSYNTKFAADMHFQVWQGHPLAHRGPLPPGAQPQQQQPQQQRSSYGDSQRMWAPHPHFHQRWPVPGPPAAIMSPAAFMTASQGFAQRYPVVPGPLISPIGMTMPANAPCIPGFAMNNTYSMPIGSRRGNLPRMSNGNDPAEFHRPTLSAPPGKRPKRKKDIVPPIEKMTEDPVVREPFNDTERAEIESWKAERRRNWPTADNLARRQAEAEARRARGQLEPNTEDDEKNNRHKRLQEIIRKQHAMGLARKAGTEDMLRSITMNGRSGGRSRRGRGRTRGGRGGRNASWRGGRFGWEAFQAAESPNTSRMDGCGESMAHCEEEEQEIAKSENETGGVIPSTASARRNGAPQSTIKTRETNLSSHDDIIGMVNSRSSDATKGILDKDQLMPSALMALQGYSSSDEEGRVVMQEQKQSYTALSRERHTEHNHDTEFVIMRDNFVHGRAGGEEAAAKPTTAAIDMRGKKDQEDTQKGCERRSSSGKHERRPSLKKVKKPNRSRDTKAVYVPSEPTLLEKLLAREMRMDRSKLLQAFRFFVLNDFLVPYSEGKQPLKYPANIESSDTLSCGQNPEEDWSRLHADGNHQCHILEDILKLKPGVDIDEEIESERSHESSDDKSSEDADPGQGSSDSSNDDEDSETDNA